MMSNVETVWPQVGEAEWCGDWEVHPEFEEVEEAPDPPPKYTCEHCSDGFAYITDETDDHKCPKCGISLEIPF